MKPRRVKFDRSFDAAYRGLSAELQKAVDVAIMAFCDRSREHALQVSKKTEKVWAFRVDRGYRVFYRVVHEEEGAICLLFHVGNHDDYRLLKKRRRGR